MRRRWPLLILVGLVVVAAWWLLDPPPESTVGPIDRTEEASTPLGGEPARLTGSAKEGTAERTPGGEEGGAAAATWHFVGRVRGPGRHPAVGARVELRMEGAIRASTLSDDAGRFRLPPGELPEGRWVSFVVLASDTEGRCDFHNRGTFPGRTGDLDVGTLVLRDGHALEVLVQHEGRPVPGADVVLFGGGQVRQGPALATTTDAAGTARFAGLPPEEFHVVAHAEGFAPRARSVGLPRTTEEPVRLELEMPRTVTVEIVEAPDETPVAGVEVVVLDQRGNTRYSYTDAVHPPLRIPPTDERGRTRIEGLGREPSYRLGVAARGYASRSWDPRLGTWRQTYRELIPIPVDDDTMRVVLPPSRRVVWPIVVGEVPAPPNGTTVAFRRGPQPRVRFEHGVAEGRVEGGFLVVIGLVDKPFSAVAETPDGLLARVTIGAKETEGKTITFTRPRTLDVVAHHEDGEPAVGISVSIRGDDEQPLGNNAKTDGEGAARVERLLPEVGEVRVHPPGMSAGRADLTQGDVRMEVEVPRKSDRSVPVRLLLRVDGKKGLPGEYDLDTGWDESRMEVLEEDPGEGVLHCRWHPGPGRDEGRIRVSSPDHVAVTREVDLGTKELAFDLESAGQLLFRFLHDGDHRSRGDLQHWDGNERDWVRAESQYRALRTLHPPLRGESWFLRGLRPGNYRAVARPSGAISEVVEVRAGREPVVLTLEVTSPGEIEGMIVGPEGASLEGAFVEVTTPGRNERAKEFPIGADHRFAIPWTYGNGTVDLAVRHALLRTHPETGRVRLKSAEAHVRLELTYGPVATVLLELEPSGDAPATPPRRARVLLLENARARQPRHRLPAAVTATDDGRWRLSFGGYEPGAWTIWCVVSGSFAPLVLPDVELDEMDPDLGTVPLTRGSSVRLDIRTAGERAPAFAVLNVEALEGPEFGGTDMRVGPGVVTVSGLGAGRYRVTGGWMGMEDEELPAEFDEEIEVDGRSVYERELTVGASR